MRIARITGLVTAGALALAVAAPAMAASPQKLMLVPASDDGTPAAGMTWVRVLHGSPDAPKVDVLVGADKDSTAKVDALSSVSFGEITDYVEVPAGTYAIKVCASADNAVCPIEVDALKLDPDTKYTIAAADMLADITPHVFVDAPAANAEQAQVRVVHLSADTPAVDVLTQNGKTVVVDNLAYPDATDYLPLPAGTYNLKVCANADNSVCPLDPKPRKVEAGKAYSAFAVGSLAATMDQEMPPTDTLAAAPEAGGSNGLAILALVAAGIAAFAFSLRFSPARTRR